jgi:hypothetical protein
LRVRVVIAPNNPTPAKSPARQQCEANARTNAIKASNLGPNVAGGVLGTFAVTNAAGCLVGGALGAIPTDGVGFFSGCSTGLAITASPGFLLGELRLGAAIGFSKSLSDAYTAYKNDMAACAKIP